MKKKVIKGPNKVVQDVLSESNRPLGAYEILERVKTKGINGPPTIYRALEKLVKFGLVHRIASTHSYVMCRNGSEHEAESVIFAVCRFCENVEEIPSKALHDLLEQVRVNQGFKTKSEVIEIVGMCRNCSNLKGN